MVYSEGSAYLEKPVVLIISGPNKIIIQGRNKALVEKSWMLIVIYPTICGLVVRLLHHPTLYGHQFFRMLIRIFRVS